MALKVTPATNDGCDTSTITSTSRSSEDLILMKASEQQIRVAVVGNVDAGKSTLISTLSSGELDDGRGSARLHIMKHKHEQESGRTSTAVSHLLGLDKSFQTIVPHPQTKNAYADIVLRSFRIVSMIDCAGHEKYLKTTIAGVSRGMADYALVLVNCRQPPTHMTIHHLKLCSYMGIPCIIVLTKSDKCPEHVFKSTKQEITRILRSPEIGQRPYVIKTEDDVQKVTGMLGKNLVTPVVAVSAVTGDGLNLLKQMLALAPQRRQFKKFRDRPFEFLVEDKYSVPGVGTVLSGFVARGEWKKGDKIFIGPMKDGSVLEVVPRSAHVARTTVDRVWAGHSVCFALPKPTRGKRFMFSKTGMVATKTPLSLSKTFTADILLTKGTTVTVQKGRFEPTLHILNQKQTAKMVDIRLKGRDGSYVDTDTSDISDVDVVMRQGDRASVTFCFKNRASYLRVGMKIIIREGHVIGYGVVTSLSG